MVDEAAPTPPRASAVRMLVAYDGTDFVGWQHQPGQRSVQGTLADTIEVMAGHPVKVRGASRTDSGVHARGQVAAFDVDRSIPRIGWIRGLNGALPPDVRVYDAAPCPVGYDPRFDAKGKHYRYLLHVGETADPLWRRRSWHLGPGHALKFPVGHDRGDEASRWLDLDAMREAASHLLGRHDFKAFRAIDDPRPDTFRTLTEVAVTSPWADDPSLVAIDVHGDAFLKYMVRIIAGTLAEVGRHKMRPDDLDELLSGRRERADAGPTAPPQGLELVRIELGSRSDTGAGTLPSA